jgi:hypothetical protein
LIQRLYIFNFFQTIRTLWLGRWLKHWHKFDYGPEAQKVVMEAITISARPITWIAKILAYRRLEIIQSLIKLYPKIPVGQLAKFYEPPISQTLEFAPLSR